MRGLFRPRLARVATAIRTLFRTGREGAVFGATNPNEILRKRNLLTWSEDFSNAAWTKANATIVPNADGASAKLVASTSDTSHYIQQSVITVGQPVTGHARLKAGERTWAALNVGGAVGYFDLGNGVIGASVSAGSEATMTPVPDMPGYYDCTLTRPEATSAIFYIFVVEKNADATFIGNDVEGIYVARAHCESGITTSLAYQKVTDWLTEILSTGKNEAFTDSNGTIPFTTPEQTLGTILDEKNTSRGPEQLLNWDFSSGAANWTVLNPDATHVVTFENGTCRYQSDTTTPALAVQQNGSLTIGKTYEVIFMVKSITGTLKTDNNNGGPSVLARQVGENRAVITPLSAVFSFTRNTTNVDVVIESISIKEIFGNHLTQATAAQRPKRSARYNQLQKTEQFGDVAWAKTGSTCAVKAIPGPFPGTYADKLIEDTSNGTHRFVQNYTPIGVVDQWHTVYVKAGERSKCALFSWSGGGGSYGVVFDLATGTAGMLGAATGAFIRPVADAAGWFQIGIKLNTFSTSGREWEVRTVEPGGQQAFVGDGSSGIYVWGADSRTAADAALNIPAYQRVNTATDYDTDGFPFYDVYDGTQTSMTSATGGGGSTGFFYCAALTVLGGAGTDRAIWSDVGSNIGYNVRVDTGNAVRLSAGHGAGFQVVFTSATLDVGVTNVITAWDDGTNLNVQIGNGVVASVARPTVVAGTASFSEGKLNSSSTQFFSGRLYSRVYCKDFCPSAIDRERIKREVASSAGLVL